ncbi:SusC/RagA family TonB-linked outer membrane protein [Roseisolibacter agri]|uniref:SusC/RagA family TonB-linked outer membrane protein n=1 Tax=Roseisolibacter agri TaxID=2014610 RepID=A0AA37Q847_9BACT|nr:SusC/RagA family TonB-linked outer membrane protein [Roseisolibacter agri]GLC28339.1 SusC/RagA family TonB-linked outer membrane protein [Roseisolibacter agri]
MRGNSVVVCALAAACAGALAAGPARAQAPARTVTGTVVEEGSGAPLPAAQVQLRGTTVGTITGDNGTFTLRVPAGDVVLLVRRIGYPAVEARVAADQGTVRVSMRKDALKLEEIVVTGQATGISRRNLPNSIASVSGEEVTKVSSQTIEQAFQGKIAGAQIAQSTGAPGGGNRVRIRGISSILGNATPLYVVDGVIVSDVSIGTGTNKVTGAAGTAISAATQESPVNRIADLDPNQIENVEILKGSAAAAIYGSKASGGVIIITTKRGVAGAPKWLFRGGVGTPRLAYRNGQRRFPSVEDATRAFGPTAPQYFDASRFIDYESLAYGNEPINGDVALQVSGGNEATRYFVAGSARDEEGIVARTYAKKYGARINVDQRLTDRLQLQAGTEVLRTLSDRGLFGNDNAGNSVAYTLTKVPSFLDLRQREDGTWPVNPFYPSNPLQTIARFKNSEGVWRNITTGRLTWDIAQRGSQELRFVAYGGTDVLSQRNEVFSPPDLQYEPADNLPGTSVVSDATNQNANANLNLVHVWRPLARLSATTQLGTQYERRSFALNRASAQNLLGGLEVVTSGTIRDVDEQRLRVVDFGLFGQTELLLAERLLLTAGARADRSSNNGDPSKFFLFPKASASYRMPGLLAGLVDELKVRLAYGETGNQPLYGQKFTPLDLSNIGGAGAFRVGTARAASDLRPERQRELEGGFDLALFRNRATLDLTAFQRRISDLLITRTLPPTSGYSSETSNGAAMKVWGFETSLSAFPVQGAVTWNTRFNLGANRSRITKLPVPAFLLGTPQVGAVRIEEGKSATQLIGNDTLPQPGGRVVVPVVMGDGNPKYNAGWGNEIRWRGLSAYALLDRQQGGMLANGTWRHYDLGQNSRDYDATTATGQKLGEVRRTTYLQVTRIYYQDASYTKLREVTLGYDLPRALTQRLWSRAQSARLQLSGRNLYWWTDFRGGDPEAENFGAANVPSSIQRNRELAAYPASRQYWLNLNVEF